MSIAHTPPESKRIFLNFSDFLLRAAGGCAKGWIRMTERTTVQIFGDSIMKGVWYDGNAGRYRLVRDRFAALEEYTVENRAVMGMTVVGGWETMQKRLHDPDSAVVLLEFGGNDCDYSWQEIAADPTGVHRPHTDRDVFVSQYAQLVEYAQNQGAAVFLCNLVPLDAHRYMDWITRACDRDAVLSWLGDASMLYRWQEYYNRAVEELAYRYGCPMIDVRSAFLSSHRYPQLLCADGIHPSPAGHAMIDTLIAERIHAETAVKANVAV